VSCKNRKNQLVQEDDDVCLSRNEAISCSSAGMSDPISVIRTELCLFLHTADRCDEEIEYGSSADLMFIQTKWGMH
jgi:hypothetical protein